MKEGYKPFVIDRAQRLDFTSQQLRNVNAMLKNVDPETGYIVIRDENGLDQTELTIDRHFEYGMWKVQKSLVKDLTEAEEPEIAKAIVEDHKLYP